MGDRVGVVVVGDADPPQFDVLRYVADGPFSDVGESNFETPLILSIGNLISDKYTNIPKVVLYRDYSLGGAWIEAI